MVRACAALGLLLPAAVALNYTRARIPLENYIVGTWDLIVASDDGLVQHKLELNVSELGALVGVLSVVTEASFLPVAR